MSYWITLKAFDYESLDALSKIFCSKLLCSEINSKHWDQSGPMNFPTKNQKYTVLKSPHVYKQSREQFEMKIHTRLLGLTVLSNEESRFEDYLLGIRRNFPVGVSLKIVRQGCMIEE